MNPYLHRSRRHFIHIALMLAAGMLTSCSAPNGSFGVSKPLPLLTFVMPANATFEQYGPHCPRDKILGELEAWLDAQPNCYAHVSDGGYRGDQLDMHCTLSTQDNACKQVYKAWLWVEYDRNSTTDYELLGYSRVRRVCSPGAFYEADQEAQEAAEEKSQALKEFLDACRQPQEVARGF